MRRRIMLGLAGTLGALVLVVLGLAATKPDRLVVERSVDIPAPRVTVEPLVTDFSRWQSWLPWRRLDPNQRVTLSAVTSGPGATYAWDGNDQVGRGEMRIERVERTDHETRQTLSLHFLAPWESRATATFVLRDVASGTRVTWRMDSPSSFGSKVFQVFADMDAMLGADFERGLADMRTAAVGRR